MLIMTSVLRLSPSPSPTKRDFSFNDTDDDGTDQASQRSISLSSPTKSTHEAHDPEPLSSHSTPHSFDYTVPDLKSKETEEDKHSSISVSETRSSVADTRRSSEVSSLPSSSIKYPPTPARFASDNDTSSMISYSSSSSRKVRPESSLIEPPAGPLVLGIALVDFNHLVSHMASVHHHLILSLIYTLFLPNARFSTPTTIATSLETGFAIRLAPRLNFVKEVCLTRNKCTLSCHF